MDPFSYLSVVISIIRLGNDAGPGRRRRDAAGALAAPALLGPRHLGHHLVPGLYRSFSARVFFG